MCTQRERAPRGSREGSKIPEHGGTQEISPASGRLRQVDQVSTNKLFSQVRFKNPFGWMKTLGLRDTKMCPNSIVAVVSTMQVHVPTL
jgi:hypothetical protein